MSLLIPEHIAEEQRQRNSERESRTAGMAAATYGDDYMRMEDIQPFLDELPEAEDLPVPVGYKLLVVVLTLPQQVDGGIQLLDSTRQQQASKAQMAAVLALGPDCYNDPNRYSQAYCQAGDIIMFRKYNGVRMDLEDGHTYFILNDDDPTCVRSNRHRGFIVPGTRSKRAAMED